MSVDRLRAAAERIRRQGTAPAALGSDFDDPVKLAVADLLDETAETWEAMGDPIADADDATAHMAVADAILGGAA